MKKTYLSTIVQSASLGLGTQGKSKFLITLICCCMALSSCGGGRTKTNKEEPRADTTAVAQQPNTNTKQGRQICWKGTLDSKINILLHYQIEGDVIVGALTYLDTKEKKPIKIIGSLNKYEDLSEYRIFEFEENGNITGIITGMPTEAEFTGEWFSPKTRKNLDMTLKRVDTVINATTIEANPDAIAGSYYHQYGKGGAKGELEVNRVDAQRIAFSALTVTENGNIASTGSLEDDPVRKDTVTVNGNRFVYQIPESDDCEIRVRFFKDFAIIDYTEGSDCSGAFGRGASLTGVYYKKN